MKPGRPTIALIEDEFLLRVALAKAMDDAGYNVVAAANGVEGLALLRDRTIDLAIVDVVLPGRMDGVALVKEALRENPQLRAILTSGKPISEVVDWSSVGSFLQKPYRVPELLATIARLLAAPD
ncbi:MAG: response regulator [Proteobacteria bacterium]|nr:response regulator [Pseudomonadota bacterium]